MSSSIPSTTPINAVVQLSNNHATELLEKITSRCATVGILGLGYVGLPLAVESAKVGFEVIGIDLDPAKVQLVNGGQSTTRDVPDAEVAELLKEGKLRATLDSEVLSQCDVIVIAVPTPLTKSLTPDLSFIESAGRTIAERLRAGTLVTLESTTYPGTTEEVLLPLLAGSGLQPGVEFFLSHSPERVDPGNEKHKTRNTPKIVGGIDAPSLEIADKFYQSMIESTVRVSSARCAELVKVYENIFRAVNVGLVNELTQLCDRMELSVWEVLGAAYTKPFGIMPFFPGPGVGGHCIPLDPHYLEHKAREFEFSTQFISVAGSVNRSMPQFVVDKAARLLNQREKSLKNARILVIGVSYKKNVDDVRESPAVTVISKLLALGARVSYHDPFVREINEHGIRMVGVELTDETLDGSDLVILATDHSCLDLARIVNRSRLVFDTRNATHLLTENREKIVLL